MDGGLLVAAANI